MVSYEMQTAIRSYEFHQMVLVEIDCLITALDTFNLKPVSASAPSTKPTGAKLSSDSAVETTSGRSLRTPPKPESAGVPQTTKPRDPTR